MAKFFVEQGWTLQNVTNGESPMLYYKYLKISEKINGQEKYDFELLHSCLNGYIKFAKFNELNDPTETNFSIDSLEVINNSLKKILKNGCNSKEHDILVKQLRLLNSVFPEKAINIDDSTLHLLLQILRMPDVFDTLNAITNQPFTDFDLSKVLAFWGRNTVKDLYRNVGAFSISQNPGLFTMWDRYANEAKGIAIEYRNLEKVFAGDGSDVLNEVKPINYCKQRNPPVTTNPSDLLYLFFTKLEEWRHEQELRVVKPLAECTKESTKTGSIFLYKIPHSHINRVITGWNVDEENFKSIKEICQAFSIPIVKAHVDGDKVTTVQQ